MAFLISFILGLLLVLLEEYVLGAFLGVSALNFYILIIPIGAIFIGGVQGYILYLGMLKGRIPVGKLLMSLAIIFGILLYPSIRYMEYRTTYITFDENYESIDINRKFKGESIKELGISFLDYEKDNLDYNNITFTGKRNLSIELPTNKIINYLDYFIKWILMSLTSIIIFKAFAKDARYCSDCKKYYREKTLFKFNNSSYPLLVEELSNNLHNLDDYKNKYEMDTKNDSEYYELKRLNCPLCNKGEIRICHMVTEGNNKREAEDDRLIFPY